MLARSGGNYTLLAGFYEITGSAKMKIEIAEKNMLVSVYSDDLPFSIKSHITLSTGRFCHDPFSLHNLLLRKLAMLQNYYVLGYLWERRTAIEEYSSNEDLQNKLHRIVDVLNAYPAVHRMNAIYVNRTKISVQLPRKAYLESVNSLGVIVSVQKALSNDQIAGQG